MATTLFAIEGKFGNTTYWTIKMHASEVVDRIRISELDDWTEPTIKERYQKNLNLRKIKREIAPYLATDDDRFIGPLLVAIKNADDMLFEKLDSLTKNIPAAYKACASGAGFLTFSGKEVMFPVDGQHRLKALKYAIDGIDESGKKIVTKSETLPSDEVVVILFKYGNASARRIFSKVNQYAKPTNKAQNLITDDDDFYATTTRKIMNELLPGHIINIHNNTLSAQSPEFSTLPTMYQIVKNIINAYDDTIERRVNNNSDDAINPAERKIIIDKTISTLNDLFENINHFQIMLQDREETGDKNRIEMREQSLLGKPVGQLCLFKAFIKLTFPDVCDITPRPKTDEVIKRLNNINWDPRAEHWQKIIMQGNSILPISKAPLFVDFIVYFAGYPASENLLNRYKSLFLESERKDITELPKMVNTSS